MSKIRQQIAAKQGIYCFSHWRQISLMKSYFFLFLAEMRILKLEEEAINKLSAQINDQLNRLKVYIIIFEIISIEI